MKSFQEFTTQLKENIGPEYLEEKLITFNSGKNYGQIVILAGSAGSGKSFVAKQYLDKSKFSIFDVDKLKTDFIKLSKKLNIHPELQNVDLSKSEDVSFVHNYIKELGIKNKIVNLMVSSKDVDRLPNIIFDMTLKKEEDFQELARAVLPFGYKPENIHLVYVLTNYDKAYQRNLGRTRRVSPSVFFQTAYGSSVTIAKFLRGKLPKAINGRVDIVLNNKDAEIKKSEFGGSYIEDFIYLNLKKERNKLKNDKEIKRTWEDWLRNNIPKEAIKDLNL